MNVLVLALLAFACVSANQEENGVVSPSDPSGEKFDATENLQIRAAKPFKRDVFDHVEPTMLSIEGGNMGSESADNRDQQDENVLDIDENRFKRQAYRNNSYPVIWGSREVFYQFDANFSKRGKSAFRKAARLWTNLTCINITKEEDDPEDEDENTEGEESENGYYDYYDTTDPNDDESDGEETDDEVYGSEEYGIIYVHGGDGCKSSVGKSPYGLQKITLGRKCETIGTAAHELAHALGFIHSHQRHDRDEYITVNFSNIEEGYRFLFEKMSNESNDNYGLPYDYGSVMHYGITAGSENRTKITLEPRDGLYAETPGSLLLSFYDVFMMNKHYNCTDICKNYTSTQCQNGGFAHPRDCSKCICPSGYGGRLCDQRPNICGQELNATSNWTPLITANSSAMESGSQDGYKKCVYWIHAPNGSYVEVKLTNLPKNSKKKEGCIYGGVEIKARKDQALTGYRFCSEKYVNLTLISNTSTLPVLTYMRRRRNDTAVELEYRIANDTKEDVKESTK